MWAVWFDQIVVVLTMVALVSGAMIAFHRVIKPMMQALDRMHEIEQRLNKLETKTERDFIELAKHSEADKEICRALVAMLNSMISGNDVEELKITRDKMNYFLTNRLEK